VELSKRYDFVIIEDDPYSEINYTDEVFRPLIAHAKDIGNEENVVYTSTFSKISRRAPAWAGCWCRSG
jgi:DNA-binding transcriptional MocR family regulator